MPKQPRLLPHLPDEILITIFLHTISTKVVFLEGSHDTLGTSHIKKYTPWIIRQVCTRWKAIVQDTHPFWSRVALEGATITRAKSLLPSEGDLMLSLSGGTLRNIRRWTLLSDQSSLDLFQGYLPRVCSLTLHRLRRDELQSFQRLPPASFTSLKCLAVFFDQVDPPDLSLAISEHIFRSSPHVHRLHIAGGHIFLNRVLHRQLPWEQLAHLKIEQEEHDRHNLPVNFDSLLSVLSLCENLRTCHLSLRFDREIIARDRVVTIKDLQELCLRFDNTQFLSSLVLPALSSLYLRSPCAGEDTITHLTTMLERSSCSLRYLKEDGGDWEFQGIEMGPIVFPRFFGLLYDLEELHLNGFRLNRETLDRIGRGELFPAMRVLDFPCMLSTEEVVASLNQRLGRKNDSASYKGICRLRVRSWSDPIGIRDARLLKKEVLEKYGVGLECS